MKYYLSIVAIFKNEHRFISQWIDFHLKVGVDHFYLYDNGGDHWGLLEPYQDYITYVPWTDEIANQYQTVHKNRTRQKSAYTHCVDHFRSQTEWIQLLDLDEFLVPRIGSELKKFLPSGHQNIGVLRVPRFNFGNAGKWKRPNAPQITCYNRRERKNSHFKDMGRMSDIQKVRNPHLIRAKGEVELSTQLYIHHHYTRSLSEWLSRSKTGGGQEGRGFRWFIGQRPWLALLTYTFLNIQSVHLFIFIALTSLLVWLSNTPIWLTIFNIPFLIWALFALQRGQNEVFDNRLYEILTD